MMCVLCSGRDMLRCVLQATVIEEDGMLSPTTRAPNSPGSSRFPLPEEVLSPGGASGYTDRTGADQSRAYRSVRRQPGGHSADPGAHYHQHSPNASVVCPPRRRPCSARRAFIPYLHPFCLPVSAPSCCRPKLWQPQAVAITAR